MQPENPEFPDLLFADWQELPEQLREDLLKAVVTSDSERAAEWIRRNEIAEI